MFSKENWKSVVGYEQFYEVSSYGRIKTLRGNRIMKPNLLRSGYYQIGLRDAKRKTKMHMVHRLVLGAFVGLSDLDCDHIDGNRINNNLENLEYVTPRENLIRAGRRNSGKYPTGVQPISRGGKFQASLVINKKRVYLGAFSTPEESAKAYQEKVKSLHESVPW